MDKRSSPAVNSAVALVVGIFLAILAYPAWGQATIYNPAIPSPPEISLADENNVNLASGTLQIDVPDLSIGSGDKALNHTVSSIAAQFMNCCLVDNFKMYIGANSPQYGYYLTTYVTRGSSSERFGRNQDSTYTAITKSGSELFFEGGIPVYRTKDGTKYFFNNSSTDPSYINGILQKIIAPNGLVTTLHYQSAAGFGSRLSSVVQSNGLMLKYEYYTDTPSNGGDNSWRTPTAVVALNLAEEFCAPAVNRCTFARPWPRATYGWSGNQHFISTHSGDSHRFTMNQWHEVVAYKPPSYVNQDKYTYQHCSRTIPYNCYVMECPNFVGECTRRNITERVLRSTQDGRAWSYQYTVNVAGHNWEYKSIDPDGNTRTIFASASYPRLKSFTAGAYGHAYFEDADSNRIVRARSLARPGEHYLTFDGRSNVLRDEIPTGPGTTVADTAEYPATCANALTCNKPLWTRDRMGNQTDYTYDGSHGGVTSVTYPAVSGVRPQIRYSYVQRVARFRNAGGGLDQSERPIWLLASERSCNTSAAAGSGCAVAGDEVVTSYEYGPDGPANNLFVRGIAVTAAGATKRTCFGYDAYGNKVSTTLPAANLAVCP